MTKLFCLQNWLNTNNPAQKFELHELEADDKNIDDKVLEKLDALTDTYSQEWILTEQEKLALLKILSGELIIEDLL